MFAGKIAESENAGFLTDLVRELRDLFIRYGQAINDDLISISDWVRSVTTTYSMLDTDHNLLADSSGGAFTITLPAASAAEPRIFRIKRINIGGGNVTIAAAGADTIDGGASVLLTAQWHLVELVSDRVSSWYLLHTGLP
jgi:hypothetical protein